MTTVLAGALLMVLALAGLAISAYFTLVYYRLLDPAGGTLPRVCRMGKETCEAVVFTRYGRLFLVPNSVLGLLFYTLVLTVAWSVLQAGRSRYLDAALGAALASVLVSVYLIHALFVKLRTPCPVCLAAHTINILIAVLLVWIRMLAQTAAGLLVHPRIRHRVRPGCHR